MTPPPDKDALLQKFAAGQCSRKERAQVLAYLQTPGSVQHMRRIMDDEAFGEATNPDGYTVLGQDASDRVFARIEARIREAASVEAATSERKPSKRRARHRQPTARRASQTASRPPGRAWRPSGAWRRCWSSRS